jgi:hypothetical protein
MQTTLPLIHTRPRQAERPARATPRLGDVRLRLIAWTAAAMFCLLSWAAIYAGVRALLS